VSHIGSLFCSTVLHNLCFLFHRINALRLAEEARRKAAAQKAEAAAKKREAGATKK
jgi:hypothetical protein